MHTIYACTGDVYAYACMNMNIYAYKPNSDNSNLVLSILASETTDVICGTQMEEVCEVQSDKAAVEITSRYSGKIVKLYAQVIRVGAQDGSNNGI